MSLLFGFSYLTPSLKEKTGLPVSATVIRFLFFDFGNPAIPKIWDPCLHAVVFVSIKQRSRPTGTLRTELRFGTQAWLSAPQLHVVWLYRSIFGFDYI
jgi:hypothetical protein